MTDSPDHALSTACLIPLPASKAHSFQHAVSGLSLIWMMSLGMAVMMVGVAHAAASPPSLAAAAMTARVASFTEASCAAENLLDRS